MRFVLMMAGIISSAACLYVAVAGVVIVHDETDTASAAVVTNDLVEQELTRFPGGYFIGIPDVEGSVEVRCIDNSVVRGGYVTPHLHTRVTVTGNGTCERLA
ncbi:MAG: hypothetical protein AAFW97_01570 [Pseudomonadota bacterium]